MSDCLRDTTLGWRGSCSQDAPGRGIGLRCAGEGGSTLGGREIREQLPMVSIVEVLLFWGAFVTPLVGAGSVVAARISERSSCRAHCQRMLVACLFIVGLTTIAALAWQHPACFGTLSSEGIEKARGSPVTDRRRGDRSPLVDRPPDAATVYGT